MLVTHRALRLLKQTRIFGIPGNLLALRRATYFNLHSFTVLVTNRNRVLAGEAAEAEAAVAGVVDVAGDVNGFEQAIYGDEGQAVRAQGFAYFVGAAGVADQVFAVGRVNAKVAGAAYRRRTNPDVHFFCAGVFKQRYQTAASGAANN